MATTDTPGSDAPQGRRTMPAGKVLVVMLVCLLVWGLLYAPTLKRASEAQPLGTRRTISLWVLTPLAAISNGLQLTRLTDGVSDALGKDPNAAPGGVIAPPPDALPSAVVSASPPPDEPVTEDSKIRRPEPGDQLRVAVVGDSLAAGLGVYLEREFRPSLVRVTKQGRVSTGLARLDYFDWIGELQKLENSYRPDLVVVMIGDNDNQSLQSPEGQTVAEIGSFAWPQGYEDRVQAFTDIAVDGGAHVAWVGLPIVDKKDRWPVLRRQNEIFSRVMDRTPNALFVDTWDRFATADGEYTPFYRGAGKVELVRATDGFHFNPRGYELVAQAVADGAVDQFSLSRTALS